MSLCKYTELNQINDKQNSRIPSQSQTPVQSIQFTHTQ